MAQKHVKHVLVIGGGAREDAILWRLDQGRNCKLSVWPGNAGTAKRAQNVVLDPKRLVDGIVDLAVDYVVIGPEAFLAQDLVRKLAEKDIPAFGPSAAAARLETEKDFALQVILEAGVPHPDSWVCLNPQAVATSVKRYGKPVAVKPRGLTGGKGVQLCPTPEEAETAAFLCGELYPGQPIVVQELLKGYERTVLVFTDGHNISPMIALCDYKTLDGGPNTGGVGSYAWPYGWSKKLEKWTLEWVIKPILRRMELRGTPFVGVLYVGLMLTKDGPKVLEFNARLGDPEAQVAFLLLRGNLLDIMLACTQGRLDQVEVSWKRRLHAVGVVMVSRGYPGAYESGHPITLNEEHPRNVHVFHASTAMKDGVLVTDDKSGRVLTVVGTGRTREQARQAAYGEVAKTGFETAMHRPDIALPV